MNELGRPDRQNPNVEAYANLILINLAYCHQEWKRSPEVRDFIKDILVLVTTKDNESTEEPLDIFKQFASPALLAKSDEHLARQQVAPLLISCAFCIRAKKALKRNEQILAWSYIADAQYWCAIAVSGKGLHTVIEHLVKVNGPAAKGASARSEVYEAYGTLANELFHKSQALMKWPSLAKAAEGIKPEIDEAFRKGNPDGKLKGISARTIAEWLSAMPDVVQAVGHERSAVKAKKAKPAKVHKNK